ncbi:hypothetical protein BJY52DRAFT_509149 [Lactarius psammicola]|nr:hypothetical protein BJY52DRAFT_509149 [Lactarius psammicola]
MTATQTLEVIYELVERMDVVMTTAKTSMVPTFIKSLRSFPTDDSDDDFMCNFATMGLGRGSSRASVSVNEKQPVRYYGPMENVCFFPTLPLHLTARVLPAGSGKIILIRPQALHSFLFTDIWTTSAIIQDVRGTPQSSTRIYASRRPRATSQHHLQAGRRHPLAQTYLPSHACLRPSYSQTYQHTLCSPALPDHDRVRTRAAAHRHGRLTGVRATQPAARPAAGAPGCADPSLARLRARPALVAALPAHVSKRFSSVA